MLLRAVVLSFVSSLLACSARRPTPVNELAPGVVFPTTLGEGHGDDEPALAEPAATSAGGGGGAGGTTPFSVSAAAPLTPSGGAAGAATTAQAGAGNLSRLALHDPPDPEPLRLADQWEYELEMKGGKLSVLSTQPRHFKQPVVTVRRFGRYAIELWIGKELVDRVRFDLPGLAPESPEPPAEKRQPLYGPPNFARGVEVRQKVLVPAAPRARQARLIDRATGEISPLEWPPTASGVAAAAPATSAAPKKPSP